MKRVRPVNILLADDDPDDRMFAERALVESGLASEIYNVEDGEELLDFLHHRGAYEDPARAPRPGLILLDLNMPRVDGREALRQIKSDPDLRRIPVIVLTTSEAAEDVARSYDLGVNAFVTKPVTFVNLVEVLKALASFWLDVVRLPS